MSRRLDEIERKAEAARLMANTTVGYALASRVVLTCLVAKVPVEEPHISRIIGSLAKGVGEEHDEFRSAVRQLIDDIVITASLLKP